MPRPRKRKKSPKQKKRRLVLEYWAGRPVNHVPSRYRCIEKQWHGVIMHELPNGKVEEFAISLDHPIF
ncbi:hypothetical protein IB286_14225 [Spongiibacter sp. KMU-158]|uniref:Uncharacterized protein n=1 Tax=Spongiibacter pelagi TaxID=2760804 RepID=A0A927C689_9GAMM|nr:hypothetical protein [Spongiibacter pelagi]MBD2860155.1 hypothetical protein [Spongiibacter pelagi]